MFTFDEIEAGRAVAKDNTSTAEMLETECIFDDYLTALFLTEHPNSTEAIVRKAYNCHKDMFNVIKRVCANPATANDIFQEIIETNPNYYFFELIALNESASTQTLEKIAVASVANERALILLSAHKNVTEEILQELGTNKTHLVRVCAVNALKDRGVLKDWPYEWIQVTYNVKLKNH